MILPATGLTGGYFGIVGLIVPECQSGAAARRARAYRRGRGSC